MGSRLENANAFIEAIDPDDVYQLASQHRSSQACRPFREPANGSYNVCYFVQFDDGVQWVVRIPLASCIVSVWDKVRSEVATVRCVQFFWRGTPLTAQQLPPSQNRDPGSLHLRLRPR